MIYCDHNATTPLRPEVLDVMLPFLRAEFGNPSSVHGLGSRARCAVEEARALVAALIGAHPAEIVFTSGGTESNNLAVQGVLREQTHATAVSTPIEHSSILGALAAAQAAGVTVCHLPVDGVGRVAPDAVRRVLDEPVALVSVGWANNEIGTVQPIAAIAAVCRARGTPLHVDAVQAAGKIPVRAEHADLLSLSAHKIGGPKGMGALFVRRGVALRPLLCGGGQERGRRAGTENVAGIVGMGEACRLAAAEVGAYAEACTALRDRLWAGLQATISGLRRNGASDDGLPNTLNVSVDGVRGEALIAALDLAGIAISGGSACAAGAGEASHVLVALGRDTDSARDGVRFSVGRGNTAEQVEAVIAATAAIVARMRATRGAVHG